MSLKDVAKEIIEAVNKTPNDYEAREVIEKILWEQAINRINSKEIKIEAPSRRGTSIREPTPPCIG